MSRPSSSHVADATDLLLDRLTELSAPGSAVAERPTRWLGARGWTVDEESTVREQAEALGRPVPALMDPDRAGMDTWLARAHR